MTGFTRRQFSAFLVGIGGLAYHSSVANAEPTNPEAELEKQLLNAVPPLGEHSLGSNQAPVVMFEYASPTCSNSAEFNAIHWPSIKADFVDTGKLRFIFREFPLDNLALRAFMILQCVPIDKYFPTLQKLLDEQNVWRGDNAVNEITRIMSTVGISAQSVEACANDKVVAKTIFETQQAAMKQFGFRTTPTFFVAGIQLDGKKNPEAIRPAIEAALKA